MSVEKSGNGNSDDILSEIEKLGSYQKFACLMLSLTLIVVGPSGMAYVITTNTLEYRCKVPECEFNLNNRELPFNQPWLSDAIPSENGKLENCYRYAPINYNKIEPNQCSADMFNTSRKIPCDEYVYATDEKNIQTEFNIHCSQSHKLAFVATVASIARIIVLPLSGYIADRFGRLPCIIIGIMMGSVFGLIKTFSIDFTMYIVFQFFEAAAYCFSDIYVLMIELLNEKDRVYGNVILATISTIGSLLFGVIVMFVHDFRVVLQIFSIPGLFVFVYYWFISESIRWLLATGRVDRALVAIKRIAKFNRIELSKKSIELFKQKYSTTLSAQEKSNENVETQSVLHSFWKMLKSRPLCLRFLNCCIQCTASSFSALGLYQYSIQIPVIDRYFNYLIMISADIFGIILVQLLLDRTKRRTLIFFGYALAGIAIVITSFISKEYPWIVVACFLIAKSLLDFSSTVLNILITEVYPTTIRNTALNIIGTIAEIGSIGAPYIVILGSELNHNIPAFLFGGAAISVAISVIFSPETFHKKLPETFEEAINL